MTTLVVVSTDDRKGRGRKNDDKSNSKRLRESKMDMDQATTEGEVVEGSSMLLLVI